MREEAISSTKPPGTEKDSAEKTEQQSPASGLLKPEVADPFIGVLFEGKYRIESKIGEGGMGAVYKAIHIFMERPVAIKFLHGANITDTSAVERFKREARASGRIQHPNAIAITDFGVTGDNTFYLVMEYLEGRSLRDRLRAEGPTSPEEALRIMSQVCDAVDVAHKREIIHRDLKPDNIFLQIEGENEVVKVLDFGIAKLTQSSSSTAALTSAGMIVGTPYYMSPEQCQGDTLDARADIYSLGIILFEMLTCKLPFTGESPLSIVLKHVSEMPPSPRQFNPNIPDAVEAVIMRALSKRREDRYQSSLQLAEEFGAALGVTISHRSTGSYAPIIRTGSFEAGEDGGVGRDTARMQTHVGGAMPTSAMPASGTVASALSGASALAKGAASGSNSAAVQGATIESPRAHIGLSDSDIVSKPKSKGPMIMIALAVLVAIGVVAAVLIMRGGGSTNGGGGGQPPAEYNPMVKIPGGTFKMGREGGKDQFDQDIPLDQTPEHTVTVKPFMISKFEITNSEYKAFINEMPNYPIPPNWKDNVFPEGTADYPVSYISWDDANAYCQWRAQKEGKPYRLPTEEEWEFAARGQESRLYTYGNVFEANRSNTKEVAFSVIAITKPDLAKDESPYSVIGLTGNLSEWTSSEYKAYPGNEKGIVKPCEPGDKVARGSNYKSTRYTSTATYRICAPATLREAVSGFRVAMDAQ